jgi:hypothetical protein
MNQNIKDLVEDNDAQELQALLQRYVEREDYMNLQKAYDLSNKIRKIVGEELGRVKGLK